MIQSRVPVSLKTEEARAILEVLRRAATHATSRKKGIVHETEKP